MLLETIKKKIDPKRVTTWYEHYERRISSIFLIGGFITDWLTLQRVDTLWENVWVLGHIVILAVLMILIHRMEPKPAAEGVVNTYTFWFTNALQFFFGGILSAFLVFYFRSAELSTSWPFILMLVGAFFANEAFKQHLARLTVQLSLFFFSMFCCFIFLVPVLIHRIGAGIFLISGFLSLLVMLGYLHVFVRFTREKFYASRIHVAASVLGIFVLMNVLYFTNLIPPIPLSLKASGVYHSIQKNPNNSYTATYEDFGWKSYLQIYTNYHYRAGDEVYAYSAVFSPSSLNITVVHEWQHYDETQNEWMDYGDFSLPVVGGRDGGFRTYSKKSGLVPGLWRVNVKTSGGQVIGRLRFEIIPVATAPVLETKIL